MSQEFMVLGKNVARKDAVEKVKGEAKYISDIQLPKMLIARFLRSQYSHARITRIDVSKAEELPGVKCVLTYQNVPKIHPMRKFEYLLDETVHFPGAEIAAIAALTSEIAEEALKLIEIEYEVLPAVYNADEALKPNAPKAHQDYGSNIFRGTDLVKIPRLDADGWLRLGAGDLEKGFASADIIVDGTFETDLQYNCSRIHSYHCTSGETWLIT
jgi:CO/xanthine dehydrogenase Mo-binding subunit